MIKYNESNIKDSRFYKYYRCDSDEELKNFINKMEDLKIDNYRLKVTDDAESDMLPISGRYTIEELIESYDYFLRMSANPEGLNVDVTGKYDNNYVDIQIFIQKKEIMLVSTNKDLELNDLFGTKTKL